MRNLIPLSNFSVWCLSDCCFWSLSLIDLSDMISLFNVFTWSLFNVYVRSLICISDTSLWYQFDVSVWSLFELSVWSMWFLSLIWFCFLICLEFSLWFWSDVRSLIGLSIWFPFLKSISDPSLIYLFDINLISPSDLTPSYISDFFLCLIYLSWIHSLIFVWCLIHLWLIYLIWFLSLMSLSDHSIYLFDLWFMHLISLYGIWCLCLISIWLIYLVWSMLLIFIALFNVSVIPLLLIWFFSDLCIISNC